jgi:cytochrome c556
MRNTVGAVSLLVVSAFQVEQPGIVESLMKAKAGYAHRLLDAVVKGDLDTARGQAFRLKAVAETADWNVMSTPDYARETEEFVRATDRLLRAAETRNLDAVALAYVQVTLSCVRCHRYVRSHR